MVLGPVSPVLLVFSMAVGDKDNAWSGPFISSFDSSCNKLVFDDTRGVPGSDIARSS